MTSSFSKTFVGENGTSSVGVVVSAVEIGDWFGGLDSLEQALFLTTLFQQLETACRSHGNSELQLLWIASHLSDEMRAKLKILASNLAIPEGTGEIPPASFL